MLSCGDAMWNIRINFPGYKIRGLTGMEICGESKRAHTRVRPMPESVNTRRKSLVYIGIILQMGSDEHRWNAAGFERVSGLIFRLPILLDLALGQGFTVAFEMTVGRHQNGHA